MAKRTRSWLRPVCEHCDGDSQRHRRDGDGVWESLGRLDYLRGCVCESCDCVLDEMFDSEAEESEGDDLSPASCRRGGTDETPSEETRAMPQTITIGLTRREEVALVWDDLHNREQVEQMPALVRQTKLWSYYAATAGDWLKLARYADGQADHYLDGGMICDADEARHIREDGHRCLKVAARIRAAVEAATK